MSSILSFGFAYFFCFTLFATDLEVAPKEPIVLVHGLLGFSGELPFQKTYWGDIPEFLRENGATVYLADLSAVHESSVRGKQLVEQLRALGHTRYHLIAHSQGGIDARWVHKHYPELIATVTTLATPHDGSPVADAIFAIVESLPLGSKVIWTAGDLVGCGVDLISRHYSSVCKGAGEMIRFIACTSKNLLRARPQSLPTKDALHSAAKKITNLVCDTYQKICVAIDDVYQTMHEQDAKKAIKCLTTHSMREFNRTHEKGMTTQDASQKLYSWGSHDVPLCGIFDLAGLSLKISAYLFFNSDEENDGVVALSSMHFGNWLGKCKGAHHMVAGHNALGKFSTENITWLREMLLNLLGIIAQAS